VNNNNEISN